MGLVEIRHQDDVFSFKAPPLMRSGTADEHVVAEAAEALSIHRSSIIDAEWIDNGPGWLGLLLSPQTRCWHSHRQQAVSVSVLRAPTRPVLHLPTRSGRSIRHMASLWKTL